MQALRLSSWPSGLLGGISVALAQSLPSGPERDILALIYCVVDFSILGQD